MLPQQINNTLYTPDQQIDQNMKCDQNVVLMENQASNLIIKGAESSYENNQPAETSQGARRDM